MCGVQVPGSWSTRRAPRQFFGMRGDGSEEVPLDGSHRIETRLGEHELVELLSSRAHRDQRRPDSTSGDWIGGVDVPVEDDRAAISDESGRTDQFGLSPATWRLATGAAPGSAHGQGTVP